jgi:hypothetical protein
MSNIIALLPTPALVLILVWAGITTLGAALVRRATQFSLRYNAWTRAPSEYQSTADSRNAGIERENYDAAVPCFGRDTSINFRPDGIRDLVLLSRDDKLKWPWPFCRINCRSERSEEPYF